MTNFIRKKNNTITFLSFLFLLALIFLPVEEQNYKLHHDDDVRWIVGPLSKVESFSQYIDWIFFQVISKLRPVTQFFYSISWKLSLINHNLIYFFNLTILSLSSFFLLKIYKIGLSRDHVIKNTIFYFFVILFFATSKFQYYGIYNLAGLKEIIGTLFAILLVYIVLFKELHLNEKKNYFILFFFYNLLIYTHEIWMAYIFLVPAMFFFNFLNNKKISNFKNFIYHSMVSIITILLFIVIKIFFSDIVFVGLGHCPDILGAHKNSKILNSTGYGLQELLGWIGGPSYLYGDDYESSIKSWGKSRVPVFVFGLFLISSYIFCQNIKNNYKSPFFCSLLFVMIVSLIGVATVCRLELRFLLPAFVSYCLIIFYPTFNDTKKTVFKVLIILMLLQNLDYYMFGSSNMYFRTYYEERPIINLIKK